MKNENTFERCSFCFCFVFHCNTENYLKEHLVGTKYCDSNMRTPNEMNDVVAVILMYEALERLGKWRFGR